MDIKLDKKLTPGDVQAILDGIVDSSGNVLWHDEVKSLTGNYFPEEVREIDIVSLKEMARGEGKK